MLYIYFGAIVNCDYMFGLLYFSRPDVLCTLPFTQGQAKSILDAHETLKHDVFQRNSSSDFNH